MAALPKKGEKVTWATPQGETHGTVEKIVTSTTKVKGHTAKATKEDPEVMVKSAKSGKTAVHKPEALKKGKGFASVSRVCHHAVRTCEMICNV